MGALIPLARTAGPAPENFHRRPFLLELLGPRQACLALAKLLGEEEFSALFHQGKSDNIQLSLIGDRTILTVIFDDSTTLGMVRLYVTETVRKLEDLFNDILKSQKDGTNPDIEELSDMTESAKDTLDALNDDLVRLDPLDAKIMEFLPRFA
jgi:hypothetical protein